MNFWHQFIVIANELFNSDLICLDFASCLTGLNLNFNCADTDHNDLLCYFDLYNT